MNNLVFKNSGNGIRWLSFSIKLEVTKSIARVEQMWKSTLVVEQVNSLLPEGRSNLCYSHKFFQYQLETLFSG